MGAYLERLGSKARTAGAFSTLEDPRTVVWMVIAWTWGSAVNTALITILFFVFDEPEVGWVSLALALLFTACWFVFAVTGNVRATFALAIGGAIAAVTSTHLLMGGFGNSGGFLFWGVGVTVVSALALPRLVAVGVGAYWIVAASVFGFLEETLRAGRPAPDPGLPAVMYPYTLVVLMVMLVPVISYLLSRLGAERERSERLLLNVLPDTIARRLKAGASVIADGFQECTVLFADIVEFTAHTRRTKPDELITQLNAVFSVFDQLTDERGAQKIKTIGDGYMAVAGVPEPRDDHLEAICGLALDMQGAMGGIAEGNLRLRIGVHTGPVVAGIIGTTRFSYDLWGETVNLASRMESYGRPGRIQVSASVAHAAAGLFEFEPAGVIDMKGIGPTEAYFLVERAG